MSRTRLEVAPGVFRECGDNVVEIASDDRVTEAWNLYADKARQIRSDPTLLADREFNEELARRHDRWRKLFLIGERA